MLGGRLEVLHSTLLSVTRIITQSCVLLLCTRNKRNATLQSTRYTTIMHYDIPALSCSFNTDCQWATQWGNTPSLLADCGLSSP